MASQGKTSEVSTVATTQKARPNDDIIHTGYEAEYWRMADALRGSMDAAEYKHVVLGLIFLKYISDAFEERHARCSPSGAKTPPRTGTSTSRRTSSGCLPRRGGSISRIRLASPTSDDWSTMPWLPSSGTTRRSRTCCPRTTPGQPWTRHAWGR